MTRRRCTIQWVIRQSPLAVGIVLILCSSCAGNPPRAGDQTASDPPSAQVEWDLPGLPSGNVATYSHIDAHYTESVLAAAPPRDSLPVKEGPAPRPTNRPARATDRVVEVAPVAPSADADVHTADLAPTGSAAKPQRRPWKYELERWVGRYEDLRTRTWGTFFIRRDGRDSQWCSGTVVAARNKSLIWTAAHCLYEPVKKTWYNENVLFVPGYHEGNKPYGLWKVSRMHVPDEWTELVNGEPNWSYDFGAVVVEPRDGKYIQDVVGAQGIVFNGRRGHTYRTGGYPVEHPYTGEWLFTCEARFGGVDPKLSPATTGIGCDMTGGASGGGWIVGGASVATMGWVISVNSYAYADKPEMYGPYHGEAALLFYRRVSR
jgi:hypothetical protein